MTRRSSRIKGRLEGRLIESIVVVGARGSNDYCIGFVAWVDSDATFVVTQSYFVEGKRDELKVCFFDKVELSASVIGTEGRFCLLRTAHHRRCKRVEFAEGCITSWCKALIFMPSSSTTLSSIYIPVILESAESYGTHVWDFARGSNNLFLVACPYTEKTFDGYNRLVVAPIFAEDEKALGVVVFDCSREYGAEMKVCLLGRQVIAVISRLIPPPSPAAAAKAKRKGVGDGSKDKKKGKK